MQVIIAKRQPAGQAANVAAAKTQAVAIKLAERTKRRGRLLTVCSLGCSLCALKQAAGVLLAQPGHVQVWLTTSATAFHTHTHTCAGMHANIAPAPAPIP